MFRNYLYLLRCVHDLYPIIKNETVVDIYTQEKDKLFFNIQKKEWDNFHLIISAHPQNSYITTKTSHHKAKKNTKSFFEESNQDVIKFVTLAENDRIIKIGLTNSSLYFLIRGADTNIIMIDHNEISHSFKRISKNQLNLIYNELKKTNFSFTPNQFLIDLEMLNYDEILKKYRFIDKTIQNELKIRNTQSNNGIKKIMNEIISEDISVLNDDSGKPVFQPSTFYEPTKNKSANRYSNYFDALNSFHTLKYSGSTDKNIKAEIEKFINKELEYLSNKLNNIKSRIDNGSKEEDYFRYANILLSNIHLIKKGMKEIESPDEDSIQKIVIELDNKLSPSQNVTRMFDKAKSEKMSFEKSEELYLKAKNEYEKILSAKSRFDKLESSEELIKLRRELKIKTIMEKKPLEEKINYKHFLIEEKYHVYIGKDSKNNDLLTTRFAKQNDLWFHVRAISGSHVVLRVDNTKEAVPKNIIKKVASLAAFHSKAKTSKLVPVAYTFKKYVVKKKDLNPGQVYLLREEVIMVPPEIPKDCILIDNE